MFNLHVFAHSLTFIVHLGFFLNTIIILLLLLLDNMSIIVTLQVQ